jgi:hypothetical protein
LCSTAIRGHSGCHAPGVNELVLNGPLDSFYLRGRVALIVGVVLSSPAWLYHLSLGWSMHYLLGLTPGGVQNLRKLRQPPRRG